MTALSEMRPGARGEVTAVDGRGTGRRRMVEMGLVRGTAVEVVRVAPLGDPIDVKLRGYQLTLRRSEAALVQIDVHDPEVPR
ncbi:MAG TPA: ferrous iron transport protein A [Acidimicrobiales bacterium]|nr:ferrous iron transport protein A [Acidimicrobiales bacterium]